MPLDPNILLYRMSPQIQPLSMAEAQMNAAQIAAANERTAGMQQNRMMQAADMAKDTFFNKILGESVVAGPNGAPQIDYQGAAKKLASNGFGPEAFKMLQQHGANQLVQQEAQSAAAEAQYKQRDRFFRDAERVGRMVLDLHRKGDTAGAQLAHQKAMGMLRRMNYKPEDFGFGDQYDPVLYQTVGSSILDAKSKAELDFKNYKEQNDLKQDEISNALKAAGIRAANTSAAVGRQGNLIKGETDLRKEFADLPEVKNYKLAVPAYQAIEDASKRNTPQSDINIIYGVAKLFDPNSVVREGEYATIANSQAIPEWLKGMASRLAKGTGKLTPETKKQLLLEAQSRIATFKNEYESAKGTYTDIATGRGLNPDYIFTPVGQRKPAQEQPAAPRKAWKLSDIKALAQKRGVSTQTLVDQIRSAGGVVE